MIKFTFSKEVPISGEISIGAIQSPPVKPDNTLSIIRFDQDQPGNVDHTLYINSTTGVYICGYADTPGPRDWQLAVTDRVLYSNDETRTTTLLPYEYQPKYDHYEYSANPSGTIRISYENGDVVNNNKYIIEYADTPMYEDYVNNGSGMTTRYDRSLSWSTVSPGSGACRFRVLLSEDLCYGNSTYYLYYNKVSKFEGTTPGFGTEYNTTINTKDDLTPDYLEVINPKHIYKYGIDYSYDANAERITTGGLLPATGVYVKRADVNNLHIVPPRKSDRQGWYARIWGGSFKDNSGRLYYVPELTNAQSQAVDYGLSNYPVLSPRSSVMANDTATILDPYTISLNEYPLLVSTNGYPNYVPNTMYNRSHNSVDMDSAYCSGITLYVNGSAVSNNIIDDWDEWNGIIKLETPVNIDDDIRATYLYEQLYYTTQVPDLCPQLHHQMPLDGHSSSGYMNLNDSIVFVALPSGASHYTNQLISWHYRSSNPSGIYDGSYNGYSTVMSGEYMDAPQVPLVTGSVAIGEISLNYTPPANYATIYDTRRRGGGLIDDAQFPISRVEDTRRIDIQDESNYYADIGLYDGQGLKKDGILVITIPLSKLVEIRGNIQDEVYGVSEDEAHIQAVDTVRRIVESNIAAGTYYVIVDENNDIWPSILPGRR